MARLVGFQGKSFIFDDGKQVEGFYLFTEEQRSGVTGTACDRVFISSGKLGGYVPVLGDEIKVNFNRWGKPQDIEVLGHGRG